MVLGAPYNWIYWLAKTYPELAIVHHEDRWDSECNRDIFCEDGECHVLETCMCFDLSDDDEEDYIKAYKAVNERPVAQTAVTNEDYY